MGPVYSENTWSVTKHNVTLTSFIQFYPVFTISGIVLRILMFTNYTIKISTMNSSFTIFVAAYSIALWDRPERIGETRRHGACHVSLD